MTRGLSGAVLTALTDPLLRPVIFYEGTFPSGVLRLWSGVGDITWNSVVWTGAGNLLGVGSVEETSDVVAAGFSVSLSGVPATYVSLAISDARQGQPGKVWLGFLAGDGSVIADPSLAQAGRLDVPQINDDADSCTITISYEGRLIDLNRPREYRYTDQSQQTLFPGDRGFEFVAGIQDKEITWGSGKGTGGTRTVTTRPTGARDPSLGSQR